MVGGVPHKGDTVCLRTNKELKAELIGMGGKEMMQGRNLPWVLLDAEIFTPLSKDLIGKVVEVARADYARMNKGGAKRKVSAGKKQLATPKMATPKKATPKKATPKKANPMATPKKESEKKRVMNETPVKEEASVQETKTPPKQDSPSKEKTLKKEENPKNSTPEKRRTPATKVSAKKKQKTASSAKKEDFSKLKVAQLKVRLKKLGLDTTGRKADLVARLTSA